MSGRSLLRVMLTPINTYGPSIVKNLGYAGYTAVSLHFTESSGMILSYRLPNRMLCKRQEQQLL